jgi:Cu/Zn superoxide dismutase
MKETMNQFVLRTAFLSILFSMIFIVSCEKNDEDPDPDPPMETGNSKTFALFVTSTGQPGGTIKFLELNDNSTKIEISLPGAAGNHPAHIHNNSGAKGGAIAVTLENVDGTSGKSETIVGKLDDGTVLTYDDLISFDGHVNVHLSESELSTLIAQGDIGPNEFTLNVEDYDLASIGASGIEGDITFVERVSGEILAIISLENTPGGGEHPAHVHLNSVASGGSIAISLNPVNGDTGFSLTDFSSLDDATPISFSQLKEFEGHVKVHLSAAEIGTVVAGGDIGANVLTGERQSYQLDEVAVAGISGTAIFHERKSGKTLVEINLNNTPENGSHPAHIHSNSAAEGGGVIIPLNNINGTTGISLTDVAKDNNDNALSYDDLIAFDGHIMVHLSAEQISTIVARGDVGNNALTGEKLSYNLQELNSSGVSGTITFEERKSGFTLATIMLNGTPADGNHPAHIHANSLETGGGIVINLNNVDGNTGKSVTNIEKNNADEVVTYDALIDFDGHVKVHLSPENLATVVAGGDIGSNGSGSRVSFSVDIRPILETNCQISQCHGSNAGIPDWSTYETISASAVGIKSRTGNKTMPPAASGRSLTDEEIQKIADWVDDGALNN